MFPLYEDNYGEIGYANKNLKDNIDTPFDTCDLEVSFVRDLQLCAMEIIGEDDNKSLVISKKLKNLASLDSQSVNLHLDKMSDYKYSVMFDKLVVQATVPFEEDKYLAVASIDKLKQYLPANIDLDVNKDLMGVAFDAFVVNRGNKNGHIINTEVALAMVENFKNKPFNIEHNRKVVVGVCTGYGFSEFGTSVPLTYDQVKNTSEPFNVVLSGYVWKVVSPDFAQELLESSDPSSNKYLSISASWELGFNEFNIAKGSKNLAESLIIDEEPDIEKLKNRLKVFGGNGYTEDGQVLFLNLQGSVLPLGIGFTNTPAAEVSGVCIDTDRNSKTPGIVKSNADEIDSSENNLDKKSVQLQNKNVKKIMEIKTIEDINDDSMKEVAASEVRDFIENRIATLSKEWELKVEEKQNVIKDIEAKNEELGSKLTETLESFEKLKADFEALNAEVKQKEIEATFQRRMAALDEEFNLSDEDRAIIAEDLQAIASEEEFEKWMKKFSTFAAAKKKTATEQPVVEAAKEVSEAQASEKTVEEIVSSAEVQEESLPNASSPQEASLVEKISAAFNKNSIKIK
jgi:hypothetical protein